MSVDKYTNTYLFTFKEESQVYSSLIFSFSSLFHGYMHERRIRKHRACCASSLSTKTQRRAPAPDLKFSFLIAKFSFRFAIFSDVTSDTFLCLHHACVLRVMKVSSCCFTQILLWELSSQEADNCTLFITSGVLRRCTKHGQRLAGNHCLCLP